MIHHDDTPERLAEAIQREVKGERVRWTGRPNPRRALLTGFGIWLFAIPWTAFALFWEASALGLLSNGKAAAKASAFSWFMAAFGLPFILIGFLMLAAPIGLARSARHTAHLITDRRLVTIVASRVRTKVTTVFPADVVSIVRTERVDGTGNLKLVLGSHHDSDGDKHMTSETLTAVSDVRRAEQLLVAMRGEKRAT